MNPQPRITPRTRISLFVFALAITFASQGFGAEYQPAGRLVSFGEIYIPNLPEVRLTTLSTGNQILGITSNQTVIEWGVNGGQNSLPLAGLSNVVAVSAGVKHSLALKSDGTVVGWGITLAGDDKDIVPKGLSNVVAIAASEGDSAALKQDGTIVYWGWGSLHSDSQPTGLTNVVAIAPGWDHFLALKSDGTVFGWGIDNSRGQITIPDGLTNVVQIAAGGFHSLALKNDGTLVSWGDMDQSTVPLNLGSIKSIACGYDQNIVLHDDGTVVAWGADLTGQTDVPTGLSNVVAIAGGKSHSVALKDDGTVVPWGVWIGLDLTGIGNQWGVLEPGRYPDLAKIVFASGPTMVGQRRNGERVTLGLDVDPLLTGCVQFAAKPWNQTSFGLNSDGTIGSSDFGFPDQEFQDGLRDIVKIAETFGYRLALRNDGQLFAWGPDAESVPTLSDVRDISAGSSFALALKNDGTLVQWGSDMLPVPKARLKKVIQIATGSNHALALNEDGTVVAWGADFAEDTIVPKDLANVISIAANGYQSTALKSDHTIVAWGTFGQSYIPTDLKRVIALQCWSDGVLAIAQDDSDGDGIPDDWETFHGLNPFDPNDAGLDSDGDGATNLEEYTAGTDPFDSSSRLRLDIKAGTTGNTLTFEGQPNRVYALESASELTGPWQTLKTTVTPAPGIITFGPDVVTAISRFYRVSLK